MGDRPEAMAFYGHVWDHLGFEEPTCRPPWEECSTGWEDWMCARLGGPAGPVWDNARKAFVGSWGAYVMSRDAFLLDKLGDRFVFETHGWNQEPGTLLAIRATFTKADWDGVRPLDHATLRQPTAVWSAALARFCEAAGIEPPQEPRWWLGAYYG